MLKKTSEDLMNPQPVVDALGLISDRLRLLTTRSAETWWDIGVLLDEVHARGLAVGAGFEDHATYASRELGLDPIDARRFCRVAHHFSRETALRFGAERLDLLLAYLEASNRLCSMLDLMRIEIPARRAAGEEVALPFSEATDDDLREATKLVRQHAGVDGNVPADVEATRAALASALARIGEVQVRVKVHQSTLGGEEYSLALLGVDPFNMYAVGQVLVAQGRVLAKAAASDNASTKPRAVTKRRKPSAGKSASKKAPGKAASKASAKKTKKSPGKKGRAK